MSGVPHDRLQMQRALSVWLDRLFEIPDVEQARWIEGLDLPEAVKVQLRLAAGDGPDIDDWMNVGIDPLLFVPDANADVAEPPARENHRIGRYKLLRLIGEGGSSVVWQAVRDDDSQQIVAIKCLKTGLMTAALRERFLVEQRLLARLAHPHIVQLLDIGVDSNHTPFLVMQYVDGQTIAAHARHLPIAARLNLFLDLASAVSFAHRNLILHRDIKPGNVLVTADGVVKLLDFGVGRFLVSDVKTATAQRALTPAYAAPEQFTEAPPTTAMDVFGLGAVLYEILCQQPPFAGVDRSRTQPPPLRAPSELMREQGNEFRNTLKSVEGDLDMIVMHAMAEDPARRYASVDAMADDVRRYLGNLPILARPPSWLYRTGRLVRRHRWSVGFATLTAVSLLASLILVATANRSIQQERNRAEQSLKFVESMFRNEWREQPLSNLPTTAELLERGVERAERELAEDPVGQVQVLSWIGRAYAASDRHTQAARVFERAFELARLSTVIAPDIRIGLKISGLQAQLHAGVSPAEIRRSMQSLAEPIIDPTTQARILSLEADCLSAENHFDEADRALQDALRILSDDTQVDLIEQRAQLWMARSQIAINQLRSGPAAEFAQHAIEALQRAPQASAKLRADAESARAMALVASGDERAEDALKTALRFNRSLSESDNLSSAQIENVLGNWLVAQGRFDEARQLLMRAQQTRQQLLGEQHVLTQDTFGDVLLLERRIGRLEIAEQGYRRQLSVLQQSSDRTPAREAILKGNLADILIDVDRLEEAQVLATEALQLRRASMGEHSTVAVYYYLWRIAMRRGDEVSGLRIAQEALKVLDQGDTVSLERGLILLCLSETELQLGNLEASRLRMQQVLDLHRDRLPSHHIRWGWIHLIDAQWQLAAGNVPLAKQAIERAKPVFDSGLHFPPSRRQAFAEVWAQTHF